MVCPPPHPQSCSRAAPHGRSRDPCPDPPPPAPTPSTESRSHHSRQLECQGAPWEGSARARGEGAVVTDGAVAVGPGGGAPTSCTSPALGARLRARPGKAHRCRGPRARLGRQGHVPGLQKHTAACPPAPRSSVAPTCSQRPLPLGLPSLHPGSPHPVHLGGPDLFGVTQGGCWCRPGVDGGGRGGDGGALSRHLLPPHTGTFKS